MTAALALAPIRLPRSDPQRLRRLLGLHAVNNPRIIDTTYGHGVFWRGLPYDPVRLDVRDLPGVDHVADWRNLPRLFTPASFDVVVWDPIHVSDINPNSILGKRYGASAAPVKGPNINSLYGPFLDAAHQVVQVETGICIVKLADQVHNARMQLAFVDFVVTARDAGWTVCDYDMSVRANPITSPLWIHEYHVRKTWAFWIVLRNGPACQGPGRMRMNICPVCRLPFRSSRRDKRTCSERCKKSRQRAA